MIGAIDRHWCDGPCGRAVGRDGFHRSRRDTSTAEVHASLQRNGRIQYSPALFLPNSLWASFWRSPAPPLRGMGQPGAAAAAVRQAEAEGLTLQPSDNASGLP